MFSVKELSLLIRLRRCHNCIMTLFFHFIFPFRGQSRSSQRRHAAGSCESSQHSAQSHASQQHSIRFPLSSRPLPFPGQSRPPFPGTKSVPVRSRSICKPSLGLYGCYHYSIRICYKYSMVNG